MLMIDIGFDTKFYKHERKIYGFFDVLGDLGGIRDVLFLATAAFLGPLIEHSF